MRSNKDGAKLSRIMESRWLVPGRSRFICVMAALWLVTGCVTNPITGGRQLTLVGRSQLISMAREAAPSQLSADYGVADDSRANDYVSRIGRKLVATLTPADVVYHDMPFSFRVVNAVYVNAYAFPDGTIAITRGMLAELENEAQLAAVLGHEIAHVNAGHTAAAISRSLLYGALVSGTQAYMAHRGSEWSDLAGAAGQLGGAVVLANYSREQERQADRGGMNYMIRAGYDPQGMVELTGLLVRLNSSQPSLLQRLFASHPMSTERLQAVRQQARTHEFVHGAGGAINREVFLAETAAIRQQREAYQLFAKAESALAQQQHGATLQAATEGLKLAPGDTVGLLLLAQANQAGGKVAVAQELATRVAAERPGVARAHSLLAQYALQGRNYQTALQHLTAFEQRVPGDARTSFYRALAYEGAGEREQARRAYQRYLTQGAATPASRAYAIQRLEAIAQ